MVGNGSRGYLPLFAKLKPQSTCHGPRPGPTLAPQCSRGPPACPATESTRKDPRAEEHKHADVQKVNFVHSHMIYTCRARVVFLEHSQVVKFHLIIVMDVCPLRSHVYVLFFVSERSGRKPPAERSALHIIHIFVWP